MAEADIESQKSTTSEGKKASIIRVAAFAKHASGNFVNLNENRVMNCFKNAIEQNLNKKELGPMTTASLVSDKNLRKEPTIAYSSRDICNDRLQEFGLNEFLTSRATAEEKETN